MIFAYITADRCNPAVIITDFPSRKRNRVTVPVLISDTLDFVRRYTLQFPYLTQKPRRRFLFRYPQKSKIVTGLLLVKNTLCITLDQSRGATIIISRDLAHFTSSRNNTSRDTNSPNFPQRAHRKRNINAESPSSAIPIMISPSNTTTHAEKPVHTRARPFPLARESESIGIRIIHAISSQASLRVVSRKHRCALRASLPCCTCGDRYLERLCS